MSACATEDREWNAPVSGVDYKGASSCDDARVHEARESLGARATTHAVLVGKALLHVEVVREPGREAEQADGHDLDRPAAAHLLPVPQHLV